MGRCELSCGLSRTGGASEDGKETGGGGNCCRCSTFADMVMAGAGKPTEVMLSVTDTDWFSAGRVGLSFPAGGAAPDSVLLGWIGGCELAPTGC